MYVLCVYLHVHMHKRTNAHVFSADTSYAITMFRHVSAALPVLADCLLIAGSAIVEEALLTGESTPQWKVAAAGGGLSPDECLHIKTHRHHVLFGGTRMLQHTGDKGARLRTPDGGCLAVVLRTGVCCCCRICGGVSAFGMVLQGS
jgi:E1-E2 ATPase